MEVMYVSTFIKELKEEKYRHPCYQVALSQFPKDDKFKEVYDKVVVNLVSAKTAVGNRSQKQFEAKFLQRTVNGLMKVGMENYIISRDLLEIILRFAKLEYGIDSPKIPTLVTLHRDIPFIGPNYLLYANHANDVYKLLEREMELPSTNLSVTQKLGRLILCLYLKGPICRFNELSDILKSENFWYTSGLTYIYFLKEGKKVKEHRYILGDMTALFYMQYMLFRHDENKLGKRIISLKPKFLLKACNDFLSFKLSPMNISQSHLRLFRKTQLSLTFSPLETAFFTNIFPSQVLSEKCLYRILSGKVVPEKDREKRVLLIQRKWIEDARNSGALDSCKFQTVSKTLELLNPVLKMLRERKVNRVKLKQRIIFLQETDEHKSNFYLYLLVQWCVQMMTTGGVFKREIRLTTIADYIGSIAIPLLTEFAETDMLNLDGEELASKLSKVAESIKSPTRRSFIYYFGHYISQLGLVDDFYLDDLDIQSASGRVDANLVTVPEMERILYYLSSQTDFLAWQDCILILCLGFYSGLRRNESRFLLLSDFEILRNDNGEVQEVNLRVKSNGFRQLKYPASNRLLPLSVLWPQKWLELLVEKIEIRRLHTNNHVKLFFSDIQLTLNLFVHVSEIIKDYLGDSSLRYHHLRHSFANWQFYRLLIARKIDLEPIEMPQCFHSEYFSDIANSALRKRLALSENTRKSMYALSTMMGHAGLATTFASYIHLRDLFFYLLNKKQEQASQKQLSRIMHYANFNRIENESIVESIIFPTAADESIMSPAHNKLNKVGSFPKFTNNRGHLSLKRNDIGLAVLADMIRRLEEFPDQIVADEYRQNIYWINALRTAAIELRGQYFIKPKGRLIEFPLEASKKRGKSMPSIARTQFLKLCLQYDRLVSENRIGDVELHNALKITNTVSSSVNNTFFVSDRIIVAEFLQLCKKLLIDNSDVKFELHLFDNYDSLLLEWQTLLTDVGYGNSVLTVKIITHHRKKFYSQNAHNGQLAVRVGTIYPSTGKWMKGLYFRQFIQLLSIIHSARMFLKKLEASKL
jgi:integrase